MSQYFEAFLVGLALGFLGFGITLNLAGRTPAKIQRNIHQEAINLGYGKWIVNTNSDGAEPRAYFQWITNNISSK